MHRYLIILCLTLGSCSMLRTAKQKDVGHYVGIWYLDSVWVNCKLFTIYDESYIYLRSDGRLAGFSTTLTDNYELSTLGYWNYSNDTLWVHNGETGNYFLMDSLRPNKMMLSTNGLGVTDTICKDSYFTRIYGSTESLDETIEYYESSKTSRWLVVD